AVDVGADDARLLQPERPQVPLQVIDQPEVALDERRRAGPAAGGLDADGPGAREDVEERPAGHRVAQDAEEGLADHLRGRPEVGADLAGELAAAERAGDDADLGAHAISRVGNRSKQSRSAPP